VRESDPIIGRERVERFAAVGRDLFVSGLVSSHGGNLSERDGDRIHITRTGAMLGRITEHDVVWTKMAACELDEPCSRELLVHRRIYEATDAKAIVHVHPPHTIHRSLVDDVIVPVDADGLYVVGEVPVLAPAETKASPEAAEMLAEVLADKPVAVLRSHGPFAVGETLERAFYHVSALEISCHVIDLREAGGR
jgi:L-fuculose-phosphate aldolase